MTKKKFTVYVYHNYYEKHEVYAEDAAEAESIFDDNTKLFDETLDYSVDSYEEETVDGE